jgi:DNA-binding HxlR family transcriptional regulator
MAPDIKKTSNPCWHQDSSACNRSLAAVRDSLYVIGGKWKLPIIIALMEGPQRFRELQRSLEGITPKVLSKELKELELNAFIVRTVYDTKPVTVEYHLTEYSRTLKPVLNALRSWGEHHREHIRAQARASREKDSAREPRATRKATPQK